MIIFALLVEVILLTLFVSYGYSNNENTKINHKNVEKKDIKDYDMSYEQSTEKPIETTEEKPESTEIEPLEESTETTEEKPESTEIEPEETEDLDEMYFTDESESTDEDI